MGQRTEAGRNYRFQAGLPPGPGWGSSEEYAGVNRRRGAALR